MRLVTKRGGCIMIEISSEELRIVTNALNDVCHGLDVREFSTRMGTEVAYVKQLLDQVGDALDAPDQE